MLLESYQRKRVKISLTPLIDVVFILLLFFMLSSSFMRWHQVSLTSGEQAQQSDTEVLRVFIDSDQQLRFQGQTLDLNSAASYRDLAVQINGGLVALSCAEGITIQTLISVADQLRLAGVSKVSIVGLMP